MNVASFPSPTSDMAEINRIQYEMEYTEGISQRMRVPEKLQVAPGSAEDRWGKGDFPSTTTVMEVPERIFIAGDQNNSRPRDLDLMTSNLTEPLALKTPPRVLTLTEQPLDFLDLERPVTATPQTEEGRSHTRLRRERSMSENAARPNGQLVRTESITILRGGSTCAISSNPLLDTSRYSLSSCEPTLEGTQDDVALVDSISLRRQIIKLNRRLQLLEEENRERTRREIIVYSITVGFWLINSWLWLRR
ncbi:mitochondrial fission factor homolog B isoform X3 [Leucoraja erinacea]|uniref:mitochondrial fission factor homolog B isoform X3 n=1 Tax=Leucoraja erinaceus TaxID=7782 RepID=UPI0024552E32|nr:mitochondrial fission factor homolog B isoform X3 [Leucoraja erinacea]